MDLKIVSSVIYLIVIPFVTLAGCDNFRNVQRTQTITIQGRLGHDQIVMCTAEECPPDRPCCNSCSVPFVLYVEKQHLTQGLNQSVFTEQANERTEIKLEFPDGWTCWGNNCEMACNEHLQLGERYTMTGLLIGCDQDFRGCVMKVENYAL